MRGGLNGGGSDGGATVSRISDCTRECNSELPGLSPASGTFGRKNDFPLSIVEDTVVELVGELWVTQLSKRRALVVSVHCDGILSISRSSHGMSCDTKFGASGSTFADGLSIRE